MENLQVNNMLKKFQQHGVTYVYGGSLRDFLLNEKPHDIDICTALPLEEVKKFIKGLHWTEKGFEVGIGRFTQGDTNYEVSSYSGDIKEKLSGSDFTINSMFYDGETVFDPFGAKEDIELKRIRSLADPEVHFRTNPQAYIRALRLSAQTGFSIDDKLFKFLFWHPEILEEAGVNRIQNEGYRILFTKYPLQAIHYLQKLGFIRKDKDFNSAEEIPTGFDNIYVRLTYMAKQVGMTPIHDFLKLFHLSKKLEERLNNLFSYIIEDKPVTNPYIYNELIALKRLEYRDNPEALRDYLMNLRK